MRLVLHAPNVHQGGGLVLLNEVVDAIPENSYLILDSRFPRTSENLRNCEIYLVRPSIWSRVRAEWKLKAISKRTDIVLCFGNLPPLFPVKADVTLFLQNRYPIDKSISLVQFSNKIRARIKLERKWFQLRVKNVKNFVVQTKSMQKIVKSVLDCEAKILPFPKNTSLIPKEWEDKNPKEVDCIYVATGEPHKNHKNLVLAWVELAECGLFPSLWLTINSETHPLLCEWIEDTSQAYNLKLKNLGYMPREEVSLLYQKAKVLIFPSFAESFGLPLIEADQMGLPIIASELDFVRDVVCPKETFDPTSVVSIARSVRRFMSEPEPTTPLLTAEEFLAKVTGEPQSNDT